eukprot:TRINITY_DN12251_c0_g1_i1.p1 TRINITY_DN12251_c0_g1~~TRINITY_DN12251_c0_g1_i1.p1  ORF type:complete len:402 (-),score=91.16 TRINITY_DN12251_c0_g1_i1:28-1200(-)
MAFIEAMDHRTASKGREHFNAHHDVKPQERDLQTSIKDLQVVSEEQLSTWRQKLKEPRCMHQLVRLLGKTLIFHNTMEEFREQVAEYVVPASYNTGEIVFRHGERGDWMGIVLSGRLRRKLQRANTAISIGELGPGEIFGDLGMFGINEKRSFTVIAITECKIMALTRAAFEDAVAKKGGPRSLSLFRDGKEMENLMADTESFVHLPCFRKLDRDFVMTLHANSEPRLCYPKQVLMKEGHFGDEMFILRAGTVNVEKDGRVVVELSSGTVLGELAVLGSDKRRTATVTCTSLCLIRALHADVFHEILDRFPTAKKVFEHAYVARMVSVHVQNSQEEKYSLDSFYGSATPNTTAQMENILGSSIKVANVFKKTFNQSMSQQSPGLLPKLTK